MPRLERSAGVLVYRDVGGARPVRLWLLLDYGRHWDYAKGHVEPGETDEQAARRELKEETGIDQVILANGFQAAIEYSFRKGKTPVHKTVVFYVGRTDMQSVRISDEHVGYDWLPYEEALERLTFDNARNLLRKAHGFLAGGPVA
ncbi:MAG: bis(5'-nucleosyl)-tetraphosphatase [Phycisphaerae bacterium]